jgi:hypothetical protein
VRALRDTARRLVQPWLLIAAGALALTALAFGAPRYSLAIPAGSISAYSEPGVYIAQTAAPRWPSWLLVLPQDDLDNPIASQLRLFEDGRALGPAHTPVADIGIYRGGRFSHWDGAIYFSASDNRDPRTNGRTYAATSPLIPQWQAWAFGWILVFTGAAWHLAKAERRASLQQLIRTSARPALYTSALVLGMLWIWVGLIGVYQVAPLTQIAPTSGYAYSAQIAPPSGLQSWLIRRSDEDSAAIRPSTLLLEDGERTGFPRAPLALVQQMGDGLYLYRQGAVYFSTTDQSDPRSNGRDYTAQIKLATPPWFRITATLVLVAALLAALWQWRRHSRLIAVSMATLSGIALAIAFASLTNVIVFEEFLPRARITPSSPTTFVADHREIVAPFIMAAPPGQGVYELMIGDQRVSCSRSLFAPDSPTEGLRCARRADGYQVDFAAPSDADPRTGRETYAVRYSVRSHPYLLGAFLLATLLFAAAAIYRPRARTLIACAAALVAVVGATLTVANMAGLFLSLRPANLASLATTFGPNDLTMTYDEALVELERRPEDTPATYAERATFTLNAAVVHAAPATELDKWRMHVPLWENWALHFLGLVDAKTRRYLFWNPHKHLERGIGLCGDLTAILVAFLRDNGVEARTASVGGHVVATVEVAPGVWHLFDPDYGLVVPYSLEEVQANPALIQAAYTEWAAERPDLSDYTRRYAAEVIPSFFASAEDNSIDPNGRDGFYSGLAGTTEAYAAREALLYRVKWVVPLALILAGIGGAILAWRRPMRRPD